MRHFYEFLESKINEYDEEYWKQRLLQLQKASRGEKGAIKDIPVKREYMPPPLRNKQGGIGREIPQK